MKDKITYTLKQLAELTQTHLYGNPEVFITGVADLEHATSQQISFLSNSRYETKLLTSKAAAVVVSTMQKLIEGRNYLVAESPSQTFQQVIELFCAAEERITSFEGIHSTAVIHPTAKIGKGVTIGPYSVLDEGVCVGDNTQIGSHCYIGKEVHLGRGCTLYHNVSIREACQIGNRVILQPGVVIGSCGFGYITSQDGKAQKLKQLGVVLIGDDVEIGANTTVDRARFQITRIGTGTKIDNLVQIGHGVTIGENCIIVAQTGIAGSTKIGDNVIIGGQAGINGHIEIVSNVAVAACARVSKSLLKPGRYGGHPAEPLSDNQRHQVYLRNVEKYAKAIQDHEKRLHALEQQDKE